MTYSSISLKAPTQHLKQLILIRSGLILLLSAAVFLAHLTQFARLPLAPILLILAGLTLINGLSLLRIGHYYEVRPPELFMQLAIDIIAVALMAYYTGGATNPFLSYLLVPICIAAAILPGYLAWPLSLGGIGLYGLLLGWYQPLDLLAPPVHIHGAHLSLETGAHLHVIGMWLNFALSALLVSYFVVRMARAIRWQQDELNTRREDDLRNEQLLAVATQAAGTAHELGTPLASIKTLLHELQQDAALPPLCGRELTILQQQVEQCAKILAKLRQRADLQQLTNPAALPVRDYCQQIIEHWQLLRPAINTEVDIDSSVNHQKLRPHTTIEQAIINVLNNAADASAEYLALSVRCSEFHLHWQILDGGVGIDAETRAKLGRTPVTTKSHGLGIGLFLTHASIERYGGQVKLHNRSEGGTCTEIILPLVATDDEH
ncbi:MAG TPA: ATP-binding protein [Cellvibrionaceae bacterium]